MNCERYGTGERRAVVGGDERQVREEEVLQGCDCIMQ